MSVWKAKRDWILKYDDLCLRMHNFQLAQKRLAELIEVRRQARDIPQLELLEIGCGTGITTEFVLSGVSVAFVDAIEPDQLMVECSKKRMGNDLFKKMVRFYPDEASTFCRKARQEGRTWDCVYSGFTLHNLDRSEQQEIVTNCAAVLRPGGLFAMADYAIPAGDDRIAAFKEHIDELFDILVPTEAFNVLRGWVTHSLDDMRESRVQDEQRVVEMLQHANLKNITATTCGALEMIFSGTI